MAKEPEKGLLVWFKAFLKERWIALAISTAGISISLTVLGVSKAFDRPFSGFIAWPAIVLFWIMMVCWAVSGLILIGRNWREPPKSPRNTPERGAQGQFTKARQGQGQASAILRAGQDTPVDPATVPQAGTASAGKPNSDEHQK